MRCNTRMRSGASSAAGDSLVGAGQSVGEDFDETLEEMHAAGLRGLFQRLAADGDDIGGTEGADVGVARRTVLADDRHFTEAVAFLQAPEWPAGLADLQLAFGQEAEKLAVLAVAHDAGTGGYV